MGWLQDINEEFFHPYAALKDFDTLGETLVSTFIPISGLFKDKTKENRRKKRDKEINYAKKNLDSLFFIYVYSCGLFESANIDLDLDYILIDKLHTILSHLGLKEKINEIEYSFSMVHADALQKSQAFNTYQQFFNAIDTPNIDLISESLKSITKEKRIIYSYEECILIQWGNIAKRMHRVELFVLCDCEWDFNPGLLVSEFYKYISQKTINREYPQTEMQYTNGSLLCVNPYNPQALIDYKDINFSSLHDSFCQGIITVLKELGAKKILKQEDIFNSKDSKDDTKASSHYSNPVFNADGSINREKSSGYNTNNNEGFTVVFDGKLAPNQTEPPVDINELANRFKSNPYYTEIIKGRSGSNKIKTFNYTATSEQTSQLRKSIDASAEVGVNIHSGGASFKKDSSNNEQSTKATHFYVEFH